MAIPRSNAYHRDRRYVDSSKELVKTGQAATYALNSQRLSQGYGVGVEEKKYRYLYCSKIIKIYEIVNSEDKTNLRKCLPEFGI
jgi:hypothetical protein